MDFFKSVFSADPGAPPSRNPRSEDDEDDRADDPAEDEPSNDAGGGDGWNLGGIIKTFATKSESVIQTYRRDLEEFRSGLKTETAAIRDAASRAVRDLPGSLEAGASAAQVSLESVGHAIDGIIAHGKDAILALDGSPHPPSSSSDEPSSQAPPGRRYTRFEAQVLAIQSDPATFSEQPEDAEDFENWRSGFDPAGKEDEIEMLLYENAALEGFLDKFVPGAVDYETFWSRYFYRVHKLQQAEDARAKLVRRAISREDEEEDLSWEVDDDDGGGGGGGGGGDEEKVTKEEEKSEQCRGAQAVKEEIQEEKGEEKEIEDKEEKEAAPKKEVEVVPSSEPRELAKLDEVSLSENLGGFVAPITAVKGEYTGSNGEELASESGDSRAVQEIRKEETADSGKDGNVIVVSTQTQPSVPDEDDLEWDEIEDLGEHEDKEVGASSSSPVVRVDLHKRLSAPEDDEDLSWDIEEEDEPLPIMVASVMFFIVV
ncbi:BSD domain-containing protein 1 [Ananas comosus]|uniref:BSD domain-containing protein 1 n=1 Tax=Ananas comosus TaxID=4615 RepID=A0A199V1Z3_ANACO|nr:BSD domain-containing protein 1 [Ananas comosus]